MVELKVTTGEGTRVLRLRFGKVAQRNWSRVAVATLTDVTDGMPARDKQVFVKQFHDANGNTHEKQCQFEREGAELAHDVLLPVLLVPRLLHVDMTWLLHIYEFCAMESVDELLRRAPDRFVATLPAVLDAAARTVDALHDAAQRESLRALLQVKERPYGQAASAVSFKGLDIRNMAVIVADDPAAPPRIAMFDFGRPYLAPVEEAAAKLYVSVGLLNWGRPVRRFVRGPDQSMLEAAGQSLYRYLDRDAILAEVAQQQRTRERDVKASGVITALLKTAGVRTLGRRYFRQLEACCRSGTTSSASAA